MGQILTPRTVLRRGRAVFDNTELPQSMYEKRIIKVREYMRQHGVDVLLVGGATEDYANQAYLSGMVSDISHGLEGGNYIIIPLEGDIIIAAAQPPRDIAALKWQTWIPDMRSAIPAVKETAKIVKTIVPTPKKVGVTNVSPQKRGQDYNILQTELKEMQLVQLDTLIEEMRRVKDDRELAMMERSARAIDLEFETLPRVIIEGIKDNEAEAKAERMAKLQGAKDCRMLWAVGPTGSPTLNPFSERRFARGDQITCYSTIECNGFWSEMGRTFILGQPSEQFSKLHQAAVATLKEGTMNAKPGNNASLVAEKMLSKLKTAGYADSFTPDYGFGHGLGLANPEKPFIENTNNDVLMEGMVLSLRVPLYKPKVGSVLIGDTIALTKSGATSLNKIPLDLISITAL